MNALIALGRRRSAEGLLRKPNQGSQKSCRDEMMLGTPAPTDRQLAAPTDHVLSLSPHRRGSGFALVMAKAAFRQRGVTRLIKGAMAAGMAPETFGIQLVDGRPTLIPWVGLMSSAAKATRSPTGDDLDDELAAWGAEHGEN